MIADNGDVIHNDCDGRWYCPDCCKYVRRSICHDCGAECEWWDELDRNRPEYEYEKW